MGKAWKGLEGATVFLLLLFVLPGGSVASEPEPQILVLVPFLIHTETQEKVCVQLNNLNESVTLTVTVEYPTENKTLIREVVSEDKFTTIPFKLPKLAKSSSVLELVVRVHAKGQTLDFWFVKTLLVRDIEHMVIIQTDKPIYKPSQTVQFRIAALDERFRPLNEQFPLVYIEDPQNNRLFQWTDVKLDAGLIQLSFPLSSEPPLGTFNVVVQRESNDKVKRGFSVSEYVLPRFEVVVTVPKRISVLSEALDVKACGKYTFGKHVPGWVEVRVCRKYSYSSRGGCYGRDSNAICETFSGNTDEHGCVSQVVKTKLFQLKRSGFMMEIKTEASIREEGTNVTLRGTGTTEITGILSKLTFEKVDPYVKPGVPFSGQVKLVDGNDLPIANETVTISALELGHKVNYTTDQEGVVLFSIDTTNATESSVSFQATYKTFWRCNDRNWVEPEHHSAFHMASWFYSPSRSYINVKSAPGVLKCGHSQPVQVHYILNLGLAKEKKIVFHYLVMAKGGIAQTGSHVLPDVHGEAKGVFSLDLAVDPDIAPQARLLLYTILPSGELVADSADFDIENCFANKVKLWFTEPEGLPGSDTQLHISSAKGSLCAITVVDESVFLLKPEAELSAKHVYDLLPLRNHQGYRYGHYSVEEGRPPCRKEKGILVNGIRYYPESFRDNEGDPYKILRDLGLKVFTSAEIYKPEICRHFPGSIPVPQYMESEYIAAGLSSSPRVGALLSESISPPEGSTTLNTIRQYFPETWLFELAVVNGQKTSFSAETEEVVPVTIPDTITEWRAGAFCLSPDVGFGLAPKTTLKAFQPFFIDLTLPYSVIRGEVFQLKATVFMYLQRCIRVKISLDPSPDFEASPVKQEDSYCLCANERKTVSWDVTPKSLGYVNFTVSAEALNSGQLCGNEIVTVPSKGRKDTMIKSLLVEPEGIEKQKVFNSLLCAGEENSAVVSLKPPENVVEGSARASFCVQGDILSSAIENLHQLLELPYGCGEQNMARLAPNIYILDYLNKTGQLTPEIRSKAIGYLVTGYQQQLKYRHSDGSYSTFGERKWETGNTWLTAFVLKTFAQARKYIYIDPEHIRTAQNALAIQQRENGCFQSTGTLLNNALKGGVGNEISLSTYVIISLLEAGQPPSNILVRNGFFCIETAAANENIDTYTRAMMAYAFTLAGKEDERQEMLHILNKLAVKEGDGSVHWQQSGKQEENAAYATVDLRVQAADVELTSYVLSSLVTQVSTLQLSQVEKSLSQELTEATRIVRWLTRQQNSLGGFTSTQDTVLGLQGLSAFAGRTHSEVISGTDVTLNADSSALKQFRVDTTNRLLLQCVALPKVPGEYSPRATGEGCVYAQTTLKYNVLPQVRDAPFDLKVHTIPETCAKPNAQKTFDLAMVFSYKGSRSVSNMAIVDVKMLSGFIPVKSSVKKLESRDNIKRTELSANHVLLYLEKLTNVTETIVFTVEREIAVDSLKPAVVKIYDYYEPEEYAVATYNAPCSTAAGEKTKSA